MFLSSNPWYTDTEMTERAAELHDLCLHYLDNPRILSDCSRVCSDLSRTIGADYVFIAHYDPVLSRVISWAVSPREKNLDKGTLLWSEFADRMCRSLASAGAPVGGGFRPLRQEDVPAVGVYPFGLDEPPLYRAIRDESRFHGVIIIGGASEILTTDPGGIELFVRILALLCTRCASVESTKSTAARFEQFMENLPAYAFIKDSEGKYIFTNRAYKKIGAVDPKARIGRDDFDLFPPDIARRLRENDQSVLHNGVPVETIEEVPYGGETQHQLTVKFPLTESDGSVRLAGISLDISRLVEVERALASSLEEKEILFRELQHRVKNTFAVIKSLLNLENISELSEETGELLRKLRNRIEAISLVYQNLYGKSSSAPVEASKYLLEIAENLIRSYASSGDGREAGIRLEADIEPVELSPDTAVPLGIILTELMTNAIKYGFREGQKVRDVPEERGRIRISLISEAEGLTFRVFNEGIPIPETVALENPESLGLRLVQALTSQLGGRLEVFREGGTEFVLCLPGSIIYRPEETSP
jgi:PAS domain S-box-containing protein